jgi:hypothetical protein
MSKLTSIIENSVQNALKPERYRALTEEYAKTGKSTGPNQSEDFVNYTKLNFQRSKRVSKTVELMDSLLEELKSAPNMEWILITESWCGDAANSVPIISNIAEKSANVDLKIVLRDDNLDLMDQFLTNGGRSIPKLIALDGEKNVLFTWGPRPEGAQMLYNNWKNDPDKIPFHDFHLVMQKWYNEDKGVSVQKELLELVEQVNQSV